MRTCAIINPNAGAAADVEAVREAIQALDGTVCFDSGEAALGEALAENAAREGYDRVVAVGGDGTIHAVVNGLMRGGGGAVLGIVPLGTGNDLARLLGLGEGPWDALAYLEAAETVPFDLFTARYGAESVYGINVAAGGFSGQVDEVLTPELKARWGPLSYLIGAVSVLPDLKGYSTYLGCDDERPERVDAVNIIVANGRTAAGGRPIAPRADPQDGLLDVVVVRTGSVVELGEVAARIAAGNYLESPIVLHRRARRVEVSSEPGMWFNVDGELLTNEPIVFEVLPAALRVVVGEAFRTAPEP